MPSSGIPPSFSKLGASWVLQEQWHRFRFLQPSRYFQIYLFLLLQHIMLITLTKNRSIFPKPPCQLWPSTSPGAPGRTWKKEDQLDLLDDKDVLKIAQKHGVTAGQVLIRYQVDKGMWSSSSCHDIHAAILYYLMSNITCDRCLFRNHLF